MFDWLVKTKHPARFRIPVYCILVLACTIAADFLGSTSLGNWAELRTYDLRFKLRGPLPVPASAPVTILAIDDEALANIPDPLMFWHKEFALVLDRLYKHQASVIGIDFIFADISGFDPEGQRSLGEVLLLAGAEGVPVVLAYQVRSRGVDQPPEFLRFAATAADHLLAFVNLTTDTDDFVRRQQILALEEGGRVRPGFALAVVEAYAKRSGIRFHRPATVDHMLNINFRGPGCFRRISFAKAAEAARRGDGVFFENALRGQIVLIGRIGEPGDEDLHSTPQYFMAKGEGGTGSLRTPGIEIHANVIATLIEGSHLRPLTRAQQRAVTLLLILAVSLSCFRLPPLPALGLGALTSFGYACAACIWLFQSRWWFPVVAPLSGAFLMAGGAEITDYIFQGREKRKLKELFKRYVNDRVIEKILQAPEALSLQGERKEVTILFADIRDFTSRSEGAPAEAVVAELTEYFTAVVTVIQDHNGMVDKFIGDGVMAIFGAPLEDSDAAFNCVRAALGMSVAVNNLNGRLVGRGARPLSIGIGIHTGEAVVGNIGSARKMEYTAIGDTVNLASRIEGLTRKLKTEILISGDTYTALRGRISADLLGEEQVRGRIQPVRVYAVTAHGQPVGNLQDPEGHGENRLTPA